jgi:DNA-binding winged helix-turn-helix (wHTH) protein/Flp pilus assembly protein TadD
MKDVKNRCYRLDDVEIDVQNLRVTVGSEIRPLEPKSFRLLLFLVENSGRVLPKEEILAAVWPGTFVSDNSLTRAITQIRKALDDDPKAPRYIETVPTVGYRFVGNRIEEQNPAAASGTTDSTHAQVVASTSEVAPSRFRPHRWAAIAAASAVVIALAAGGGLFYSRKVHALTNKDTIVLADFANSTGDPVFDDTLKQGLAVQLGQSPLLNILPEQKVRSTLQEMRRTPDEALTARVAQEVCERTGSKAYITGSIANLGGPYVIGLNAIHCATGDVLGREQTEAGEKKEVLAALGRVAERLRKKLGESLNSIQKFDVPLAQATTSSLEALKAYSLGLSKYAKGDPTGAIPLFQQAIALDPDFAIAYAHLGRAYQIVGPGDLMDEALRKAFALRNRTSEREKFDISAGYYQFVTNEIEQTIQICERWAQTYPVDFTPHRILGYENASLGRWDQSAGEFGKANELDPSQSLPYGGLIYAYMALNRRADAHAVCQRAQARKLDIGEIARVRYRLAFLDGDKEMMAKVAASLSSQPGHENKALLAESTTEAYYGHLRRALELSRLAEGAALGKGDKATSAGIEARAAFLEALFGNSVVARRHAVTCLSLGGHPTEALALAGDWVLATKEVDRVASSIPPGGSASKVWVPEIRASIELKRGNPMRAVELLVPVTPYESGWEDTFQAAYLRGEAYLAARRGQEAAAEFQKIISHPGVVLNAPIGALAHLGVARSYVLAGDSTKARTAYQDFLTLWKDADPDIPILIAAKSEYAKLK